MKASANLLSLALLMAAITPARATEDLIPNHPALNDRFYFALGAFWPQTTTSAQLNSTRLGAGASIDFENALGLSTDKSVPSFIGRWRFGERWRLEAEYFELNRGGSRSLDRSIQFGDLVFPITAQVTSKFNFSDLRLSVDYSFFKTPDKEVGAGLGLHRVTYDVSLAASLVGTQQEDVWAPLPVLNLYGQFALTEKWAVGARLSRLSLSYGRYDGSLTSLELDVLYQPFRHVGFGIGDRSLDIKLDVQDGNTQRRFKQALQGPLFYMNVSF